jgi:hypothetical protein
VLEGLRLAIGGEPRRMQGQQADDQLAISGLERVSHGVCGRTLPLKPERRAAVQLGHDCRLLLPKPVAQQVGKQAMVVVWLLRELSS